MSQSRENELPSKPVASAPPSVRVRLQFSDRELELPPGEVLLGRSPKCQIVIDDPLISRTHAKMFYSGNSVVFEDLGSANGTLVNGERLLGSRTLASGDQVVIGEQTFKVIIGAGPLPPERDRTWAEATMRGGALNLPRTESEKTQARQGDAFELLAGVADKVLALHRGDEAERILGGYLRNLLQTARVGGTVEPALADRAAQYAIRIAETTHKGGWIDYLFELYGLLRRPLPSGVVDRLYGCARKLSAVSVNVFRQYLSVLRYLEPEMGPADRFVLRRIEGIEALGVLK